LILVLTLDLTLVLDQSQVKALVLD